jgi:hypothetical protein
MIEALRSGHIRQAGPDVLAIEPLLASYILTTMASASPGWRSKLMPGRNRLISPAWLGRRNPASS